MIEKAKVDFSKITFVENLAFFQGEIFSGIALEICGNTLKSEKKYIRGVLQENYIDNNFPVHDKCMEDWVSFDSLEMSGFDFPYFYEKNNMPYSGFVFDLSGGIFINEIYCKNGYEVVSFDYMRNGKIYEILIIDDHKRVLIKWDEYGVLSQYKILMKKENNAALEIFFDGDLKIRFLCVGNRFFDAISKKQVFFCHNEEISFVLGFGGAELMSLKSILNKFYLSEDLMILTQGCHFNQGEIIELKNAINRNNFKKITSTSYVIESLQECLKESSILFQKIL